VAAYDDLLIGGTSIKTIGYIADFAGIFADGPLRGSNLTYPGVAGDTYLPKVKGAYVFTVPLVVVGPWAAVNTALAALRALLNSSTTALAMTRHRSLTGGTSVQTAAGDYLSGLEPALVGWDAGRIAIDLINLNGQWA